MLWQLEDLIPTMDTRAVKPGDRFQSRYRGVKMIMTKVVYIDGSLVRRSVRARESWEMEEVPVLGDGTIHSTVSARRGVNIVGPRTPFCGRRPRMDVRSENGAVVCEIKLAMTK